MHFYLFLYGNLSVYRDIMISKFGGIGLIQGSADGMQLFFKGHFSKSDMFARTGLKCHLLLTLGRLKYLIERKTIRNEAATPVVIPHRKR